ncbi:hypothetical protein GSF70_01760 [Flavobacteriaceae bacterium W22]|nr:hypothetical protein [Flavobacteriaceae bacterium W22]
MNKISFQDTHIYPGCLAIFNFRISLQSAIMLAVAEFSDGAVTNAEIEPLNAEEVVVYIDGYTTTKGTNISKKNWLLKYDNAQDIWKVVKKK